MCRWETGHGDEKEEKKEKKKKRRWRENSFGCNEYVILKHDLVTRRKRRRRIF